MDKILTEEENIIKEIIIIENIAKVQEESTIVDIMAYKITIIKMIYTLQNIKDYNITLLKK